MNEGWNQRAAKTTEPIYLKFLVNVLITMHRFALRWQATHGGQTWPPNIPFPTADGTEHRHTTDLLKPTDQLQLGNDGLIYISKLCTKDIRTIYQIAYIKDYTLLNDCDNLYLCGVLNLNPMMYHCIRKTIVNEDDLSAYDIISRAKLMENLYPQLIHYLNNNKYLKSFEDKSVSLRYLLLERKLMENLEFYKHKHFFDFSTTKLLANFRDFDILFISSEGILYSIIKFFWLSDFFLTTLQKKILRKNENFCGLKITQKKSKYFENLAIIYQLLYGWRGNNKPQWWSNKVHTCRCGLLYYDTVHTLCSTKHEMCSLNIFIQEIFYKLYETYKSDNMFFGL
ncbi:hypothetical protein AGLY_016554 [Aphis glycines]|uniref:Uncharacterized protein n=1 Tax=Aphis glycines TaxID=307491 RepID=A0A6G0SZG5_APHGL|nr:hypothetical protein AGLY_016554 [Aphis glycines]